MRLRASLAPDRVNCPSLVGLARILRSTYPMDGRLLRLNNGELLLSLRVMMLTIW
jgi:hypothetical protein